MVACWLKKVTWDLREVIWDLREVSGCPSGFNEGLRLLTMRWHVASSRPIAAQGRSEGP